MLIQNDVLLVAKNPLIQEKEQVKFNSSTQSTKLFFSTIK